MSAPEPVLAPAASPALAAQPEAAAQPQAQLHTQADAQPQAQLHTQADAQPQAALDPLLEEYQYPTMFGPAEIFAMETDEGVPVRVLYVGGGFQSVSFLGERRFEPVFAYYRALDALFQADLPHDRMLMIGGGGFSYPKHLLTTRDHTAIDVVEVDPTIIQIARDHFFVDEIEAIHGPEGTNRLHSFAQDGLAFLEQAPNAAYSAVINDSFDGTAPTSHLLSDHALAQAKRCLIAGGLYLLNLVVDEEDEPEQAVQTLQLVRASLTSAFAHVFEQVVEDQEFGGADNHIFVATDGPHTFSGFDALSAPTSRV